MQDLFIEFLPPWVETGLQPAFYDRESGTVLQQTARMYAKVNELVKAVNGMDKIIKEYVDYIDNYFKNLDVQEEINNKLDDMAESGELETVIAQFLALAPVFGYNTISDMASATNLSNGSIARILGNSSIDDGKGAFYSLHTKGESEVADGVKKVAVGDDLIAERITEEYLTTFDTVSDMADAIYLIEGNVVKTLGYSSAGDGKGAFYIIEALDSQVIDNNLYVAIGDSLVAHKNIEYGYADPTNPIYYGADPTGTIDSVTAIQACIDANEGKGVTFTGGKYLITDKITTPYYYDENVSINFNGSVFYSEASLSYVLGIGMSSHGVDLPNRDSYDNPVCFATFENFTIDAPNATVGIYTELNYMIPRIYNCTIKNTKIGVKVGRAPEETWSANCCLDNVTIYCHDYKDTDTRGIVINGHDNRISNVNIYNAYIGIENFKNGNYFTNVLIYLYGHLDERNTQEFIQTFPNTVGVLDHGNANTFTGVYVDTYGTAFKSGTAMGTTRYSAQFNSCNIFSNTSNYNLIGFDFSAKQIAYVTITNGWFDFPQPATTNGHIGIKLSASQRFDTLQRCLKLENNVTFYISQPDILRLNETTVNACPYSGVNTLTANKYYVIGYTPIQSYGKYTVRMTGTGNYNQACTFNIGSSYNIESITNIGEAGSRYGIGGKVVTINGVHYLEISVMSNTGMAAILGIFVDKFITSIGFGIIPAYEPHIVDAVPTETTPTETVTFSA